MKKRKVIVVCGPTGVGKTRCAILLANRFGGEIIGADAVQVYRGLDIGSAKPTPEELSEVRHHLIDFVEPIENYDAVRYYRDARGAIDRLHLKNVVPFIVGGTGLYIRAVLNGIFQSPATDPGIRSELRRRMAEHGPATLHQELKALDPLSAQRLHPNDSSRILRALEVVIATGRSISLFQAHHGFSDSPYEVLKIGLFLEREFLYDRINNRVNRMFEAGFLEEVKGLLSHGYGPELKAMQSLGYRHVVKCLLGESDLETAISSIKRDHRRYAKRQMTWFRADPDIHWFSPEEIEAMTNKVGEFLSGSPGGCG